MKWIKVGIVLFSCCFLSCAKKCERPDHVERKGVFILVSARPYANIVEEIGGGHLHVQTIVPDAVDPHHWEPTPRDLEGLEKAAIWFTIGEKFEQLLLEKLCAVNPNLLVIPLDECVADSKSMDTHFWLNPISVIEQSQKICMTLSMWMPAHTEEFTNKFLVLQERLLELDKNVREALAPFYSNVLVSSHGAFFWFCERYCLFQIALESPQERELGMQDVMKFLEKLEAQRDKVIGIFLQPQHNNKAAQSLAKVMRAPMFHIDPYQGNYEQTISQLMEIIVKYGQTNSCS